MEKLGAPVGFAAGAVVGGLAFLWIGWLAFVQVERGLLSLLVFFVGFLAYMGSFFTPLTLVLFLGKGTRTTSRTHSCSTPPGIWRPFSGSSVSGSASISWTPSTSPRPS